MLLCLILQGRSFSALFSRRICTGTHTRHDIHEQSGCDVSGFQSGYPKTFQAHSHKVPPDTGLDSQRMVQIGIYQH